MTVGKREILLCNCEHTMTLDAKKLAGALGLDETPPVYSQLCRSQVERYMEVLGRGEPLLVACTQEAPLFGELAEEAENADLPSFTNIRERAGWTEATGDLTPKIAALLAEAAVEVEPAGTTTLTSDGVCLVYGKGQQALEVARRLCGRLSVSLLLEEADDVVPPSIGDVPIYKGKIAAATGHFGAFEIVVDGYAPIRPASRGEAEFLVARDGASSQCDLILDMTGGAPLFPSHKRRDGYFHVDPARPGAVAEAMFEIADLVGEFEKPIYVTYDPAICSHSRSRKTGCTRCLDVCPASAISSEGDRVSIDTAICGGCGACHAVCPSGAVSYAYPRREDLLGRLRVLLATYRRAGGTAPVLLIHDSRHGAETIAMMARFGRGLPANVLPFAVNEVSVVGHDLLVAALTFGAQKVVVLADPAKADELVGLTAQCALVSTIVEALGYEGERVSVLVEADPAAAEALLWESPGLPQLEGHDFNPAGTKRAIVRTALASLNDAAPARQEIVSLPEGAPYGRISIDTGGCTLCLACVSACPMGALLDNPERPQVRFVESACVQCGLCRTTCPEGVISLEPRYNFTAAALSPVTLNEEEPFACIRCGKPFGSRGSVERIVNRLAGKHWMFGDDESVKLIQMCDNCRILAQAETGRDPFAAGPRPKIRTTEDYLAEEAAVREGGRRTALTAEDFLSDDD